MSENFLGGIWDTVSGWAGDGIKKGASWVSRQVVDGVTSTFTGSASPESDKGFEPGAWLGKALNGFGKDMPWYAWLGGIIGMFLGGSMGTGIGGTMKMGALGLAAGVAITYALSALLGDKTKNDFKSAATGENAPAAAAKPVARNIKISGLTMPAGYEPAEPAPT